LGGEESGVRKAWFEGQGHVVPIELRQEFNELIEDMVEKGNALNANL
jgi:hypothetical protein